MIKNICLQTTGFLREYVLAVSSLASGPLRRLKVLVRLDCPFRQLDAEVTHVYDISSENASESEGSIISPRAMVILISNN